MAQITLRISDEDHEALRTIARIKGLRPLTYASYLLTNSVKGHAAMGDIEKDWEKLEGLTQHVYAMKAAGYDRSKLDQKALSTEPDKLEERFGWPAGEDVVSRKELTDLGATSIDIVDRGKKSRITSHEG